MSDLKRVLVVMNMATPTSYRRAFVVEIDGAFSAVEAATKAHAKIQDPHKVSVIRLECVTRSDRISLDYQRVPQLSWQLTLTVLVDVASISCTFRAAFAT